MRNLEFNNISKYKRNYEKKYGVPEKDFESYTLDVSSLPASVQAMWNSMNDLEKASLARDYNVVHNDISNLWGLFGDREGIDVERLLEDLAGSQSMLDAYTELGASPPTWSDYLDSARAEASELYGSMYDDLDALALERENQYQTELDNIRSGYRDARANLMSQNYRQNAQLMDTLQSEMSRSRRNALEAGATAGIRIAGNINTLLSVQNKQSATSMDTANQLSQMMINQRNAEASANRSYNDYMTQNTANKHALKREEDSYAQDLADRNYSAAKESYDSKRTDFDSKYSTNPLYDKRSMLSSYYGGK